MSEEQTLTLEDRRDRKHFVFHITLFRRFIVALLRVLFWPITKRTISGLENLPAEGAVVLASNHLTNFDVFPMQLEIPRPLFFMAKSELHKNPILDVMLRYLGAFPVYRGEKDQWAIRHAEKVLEHGQVLAMFPEGSRSKGRGLRPGKTGAARLALHAQCAIIPVAVEGSQKMFTRFPRRTPVKITIGEAITPEPGETTLGLTDRLMFTIAGMLPEELRGVYAKRPAGFE
jgi:1-acyl-sn-glycerol-3-phosphate acyltransferase